MTVRPPIDYTNKDFNALREAMLNLARHRLPEWTDRSPADLGVLLVDLFAYMGDIILYYQDRIANEMFLGTAHERRSIMHMLRLIGYELKPPIAATAELTLYFTPPSNPAMALVTVPSGAQFATKAKQGQSAQTFEYLGPDLEINLDSSQVTHVIVGTTPLRAYEGLPVRHSRRLPVEALGISTGEPNQMFKLSQSPLILETLTIEVFEGGGWVEWRRRDNFLYHVEPNGQVTVSNAESRDYCAQYNEKGEAFICFGDGVFSRQPPAGASIRATYATGGGTAGNVLVETITEAKTTISQLKAVFNPHPAAGGADAEATDHAVQFGPLAYRSGQRAVTLNDFVALAHQAGGVAKVRARNRGWNQIDLYIAPEGDTVRAVPEDLKRRLTSYFEHRRMVGTFVTIQDPIPVEVEISVEVVPAHRFSGEYVRQVVENTIRELVAYKNVDFGQPLYLSKVYEAIEALESVYVVTVTRFRRHDTTLDQFEQTLNGLISLGVGAIPESVKRALKSGFPLEGRIDIGEFEIPALSELDVKIVDAIS